ncbi:SpaH/EbpB family LPXTG-anchored major pilin [Enterococcus pseudoavium]|uniref:SpaH/EbpB family LPXTG-anchored major pilin n=1 Tax=Enterococcus pseudoavium TaxID=44007 RepID=A0ABU3FI53_9ENTE|nr:SpaH/EbpB family LPXTG-anchored major pilin [Enterococcus pseudoavium]MDT2753529.1 SpaH/EbpB family LPXTG-anchored major pilin [Enterococcus pseudoavium]MDT2770749.1 SpaH/EbpB family LPXTG-anchored major pilin [Enterococcus pseudoavium]
MKKQKIFCIMTALMMLTGSFLALVSGQSAIAASTEQNVKIHKVHFEEMPESIPNTGDEMVFPGTPLAGAIFTAYDVTTTYWSTYDTTTGDAAAKEAAGIEAAQAVDTNGMTGSVFDATDDGGESVKALPTTSGGKKAIYKFVETTTPAGVNQTKTVPFILGLPIYAESGSLKNFVHVYPKNEVKTLALGFTKYGIDEYGNKATLEGAEFILKDVTANKYYNSTSSKFDVAQAAASKIASVAKGQVKVEGLVLNPGVYEFYEVDSAVSTNSEQSANEKFHYKNNPVVTATVAKDMTVSYSYYNMKMEQTTGIPEAYNYKVPKPTKAVDDNDVDADQEVKFTITQTIPSDIAQYTKFALVDKFDSRLTQVTTGDEIKNSVKINGDAKADVTAVYTSDTNNQFTLAFTPSQLVKYAGQTLTFTIDMKVRPGANLNQIENQITFENDFFDKSGTAIVKTFGKKFKKVDADTGEALQGAEFKIKKGQQYLRLTENGGFLDKINGVAKDKTVTWTANEKDATVFVAGSDGIFGIYGLQSGSYQLVETKAPAGYNMIASINFAPDQATTALPVVNKAKGILPSTGGIGIVGLVAVGLIAIFSAVVYFKKRTGTTEV